jgi:LysR family carnitine catabolism transcriptional activator
MAKWGQTMELRQLEALVAIAREGSFTRAAEVLTISQPSLSARIRHLERHLGCTLLDRHSRPVRLTAEGEAFLPYAERALYILEAGEEAVQDQTLESVVQLRVGCAYSVATYLMPQVVDEFSAAFPRAELYIETGNSAFVVSQVANGLVNLALAAAFPEFLSQTQPLLQLHDQMTAAVAPGHPLIGSDPVPVAEIWPYRVLLIHWGPVFHAYVESLRRLSANRGPLVRVPLAGALPMAHRPDTVTFMPRRLVGPSGLTEITLEGFSFGWDVALLTRPGRGLARLEQSFVDIVNRVWLASSPRQ